MSKLFYYFFFFFIALPLTSIAESVDTKYSILSKHLIDGVFFPDYESIIETGLDHKYSLDEYQNTSIKVAYGIQYYDNKIFITDCPASKVKVFDSEFNFLYDLSDYFKIEKLDYPSGITFDNKNNIYILEEKINRIFKGNLTSKDYEYIKYFDNGRTKVEVNNPLSIYFKNNLYFLANTHSNTIIVFNDNGHLVINGYHYDDRKVNFDYPYYLAFSEDSLFVNDSNSNVIVQLQISYDEIERLIQKKEPFIKLKMLSFFGRGKFKDDIIKKYSNYPIPLEAPNDVRFFSDKIFIAETNTNSVLIFKKKLLPNLSNKKFKFDFKINHLAAKIIGIKDENHISVWGNQYIHGYDSLINYYLNP